MDAFRTAVEAGDLEAMSAELSDDVEFHSPVAFKPFVGRESASGVLAGVMSTFTEFEYTDELHEGDSSALVFSAKIGDKKVQGLDYLKRDADGKIEEFTVMLRPLSAIVAMGEAMAPKVEGLAKGEAPK
ncbi:MAG: nuclear transport factor 2 family protein [Solirubrobacterales bacterium]